MPRITDLQARLFRVPLPEVMSDAKHGDHTHFELVTVTITTEDGHSGTGYTYTGGFGGRAILAMVNHDLRSFLLGQDATAVEALYDAMQWRVHYVARGGIVDVCLRSGQGCVLLSVKDSGSGIPQDKQAQLFDRWQHSHMDLPAHGLGLGLPLCRRIAQGHGGSLVVSSRQGEGTAVTVRLPDRRSGVTLVRQPLFHYAGGFNPVLVELADALPVQAFTRNYID